MSDDLFISEIDYESGRISQESGAECVRATLTPAVVVGWRPRDCSARRTRRSCRSGSRSGGSRRCLRSRADSCGNCLVDVLADEVRVHLAVDRISRAVEAGIPESITSLITSASCKRRADVELASITGLLCHC